VKKKKEEEEEEEKTYLCDMIESHVVVHACMLSVWG
jgi:hypothetical protein